MNSVDRLGLRVVGVTVILLVVVLGLYWIGKALLNNDGSDGIEVASPAERQQDSDGDGVADLYETTYYNTDPNKKDTDGDGTSDLDEILAGRDPAASGPNDVSKPPTGDLVTTRNTYTEKYLATLPTDISRDQILDQSRLTAFVEENKGALLPEVAEGSLKFTDDQGATAVKTYLDNTSSTHNKDIKPVTSADFDAAFRLQVNSGSEGSLQTIIDSLSGNLQILKDTPAPAELRDLHIKSVAAADSLLNSAKSLQTINQDFVGGLIAARRIEEIGSVYQEIAADIQSIENKYGLE